MELCYTCVVLKQNNRQEGNILTKESPGGKYG